MFLGIIGVGLTVLFGLFGLYQYIRSEKMSRKNEELQQEIKQINKSHTIKLEEVKGILQNLRKNMTEEEKVKIIDDYLENNLDRILREIGDEMKANSML